MDYSKGVFVLRNRVFYSLLLLSGFVFSFSYGFAASQFKVFPYTQIRDARTAAQALIGATSKAEIGGLVTYRAQVTVPTVVEHHEQQVSQSKEDYILVSAGGDARPQSATFDCMAWITNRRGELIHAWKNHPDLWDDLQRVTRLPGIAGAIQPAGIHLCDNGDLLATFHGHNTYPFAIGMARFDKEGNVVWKKELLTHHLFSVATDGRIFVPALEVVDSPLPIGNTAASIESLSGKIYSDVILILDSNGNETKRISIQNVLNKSGWVGHQIRGNELRVQTDDPTHLNDAHRIGEAFASQMPGWKGDDLLVSLRNINAIGVLDPDTEQWKWMTSGSTVGQHSPRFYKKGVLVLDNLGGDQSLGGSRLVHIDFISGLPATIFPKDDVPMPDLCRTINSGYLDIHEDASRALLAVSHEGAIWEIDLASGKVTWEYILVEPNSNGRRKNIGFAKYVHWSPKPSL